MTRISRSAWSVLLGGLTLSLAAALLPAAGPAGAATATAAAVTGSADPAGSERVAAVRSRWRVNGTVYAIAVLGRRVYVGGDFDRVSTAGGATRVRHNLVAFRRGTGQLIAGWRGSTNGPVRALAASARTGRLFVGGGFTRVGGRLHSHVAAVSLRNGGVVNAWRGSTNGSVRDIVLLGRRVYISGAFFQVRGAYQHGLAALTVRGGARVAGFRATLGSRGQASAIAVSANRRTLVVGGTFDQLSGAPRRHLGSVRLADGLPTRWRPAPACGGCAVLDLTVDSRRVYAAMSGNGGRVVAYRAISAAELWSTRGNGDAQTLALSGGTLFVGGHFSQLRGLSRGQAAALVPATGRLRAWRPMFRPSGQPGVWAITPANDFLRVGGAFTRVGTSNIRGYVEFRVG